MNDKQRLLQWMADNQIDAASLARATGDVRSAISMMTVGRRDINQAFKWRFGVAFGFDVAQQIFVDEPVSNPQSESVPVL